MPLKDPFKNLKSKDELRFMQIMILVGVIFIATLFTVILFSIYQLW